MMPRRIKQGVAAALLVVLLAGCAAELPRAPRPVPAQPLPVVTAEQESRILTAIKDAFAASDGAGTIDAATSRATVPALEVRAAQYAVSAATGDPAMRDPLEFEPDVSIVAASDQWPRFFMVISVTPVDVKAPFLMVIKQQTPRDPYRLWGWSRMLRTEPSTPKVAASTEGVKALAPDAAGFQVTPAAAVAQYADVRQNRDASPYVNSFVPDKMRLDLDPVTDSNAAGISSIGTIANTFVPVEGEMFAIETADGGAWVVGLIRNDSVWTVTSAGATMNLNQASTKGLNAKETFSSQVTVTSLEVMSFYVPPEGSTDQITVIAAEHASVSVTGE